MYLRTTTTLGKCSWGVTTNGKQSLEALLLLLGVTRLLNSPARLVLVDEDAGPFCGIGHFGVKDHRLGLAILPPVLMQRVPVS